MNEPTRKIQRKSAKKVSASKYGPRFENLCPSFTKKGPGRYHVQGGSK